MGKLYTNAEEGYSLIEPSSVIFMIVGPHSGFSLDEIISMKQEEEREIGYFYWGYAGSLCHPPKVREFIAQAESRQIGQTKVVMAATKVAYASRTVGTLTHYSVDRKSYYPIEKGVTLIGCTIAVTCTNLERCCSFIDLNRYRVANGSRAGVTMGNYIRSRVNKACGLLDSQLKSVTRVVPVVATADLVEPYCVYLAG